MRAEVALRIARQRRHIQHLAGPRRARPEDVVGWLGAVQSQEYGPAKWSLAQRTDGASDTDVEKAFADGDILRTHVLRPTWHFVRPADIRWMLDLTAPRVRALSAYSYRRLGLDEASLNKATTAIERALRGGNHLLRKELKAVLEKSRIDVEGQRLVYFLMHAELNGLICSGARRGKQHTYALLEERVPDARELTAEQALAELTLRYFTSHGPATLKDFAWWSSLKVAQIKQGLEMVGSLLIEEEVAGTSFWFADPPSVPKAPRPGIDLLQPFDEYVVGYQDSRHVIDTSVLARSDDGQFPFNSAVVLDSQLAGRWKPTLKRDSVLVEISLYAPPNKAQEKTLEQEARRYARFLGLTPELAMRPA